MLRVLRRYQPRRYDETCTLHRRNGARCTIVLPSLLYTVAVYLVPILGPGQTEPILSRATIDSPAIIIMIGFPVVLGAGLLAFFPSSLLPSLLHSPSSFPPFLSSIFSLLLSPSFLIIQKTSPSVFSSKISRAKFATYTGNGRDPLRQAGCHVSQGRGKVFENSRRVFAGDTKGEERRGREREEDRWREREREQKEIRRSRRRGIFLWTVEQPPCDYPGRGAYMSNLYSARSSVSKFEST